MITLLCHQRQQTTSVLEPHCVFLRFDGTIFESSVHSLTGEAPHFEGGWRMADCQFILVGARYLQREVRGFPTPSLAPFLLEIAAKMSGLINELQVRLLTIRVRMLFTHAL